MANSNMQGKTVLLTGATRGIGLATAQGLAAMGTHLIIVGREPARVTQTVADLKSASGNTQIVGIVADLSSQAEVRRLAAEVLAGYPRLDVLLNNAGAVFTSRGVTVDGIERTFALNHLSYFLLTNLLIDRLKESAPARVVSVASAAHAGASINFDDLQGEKRFNAFSAYGQSKLANILFTKELARRLEGTGVTANALHPGFVASGFGKNNGPLMNFAMNLVRPAAISTARGAQTSIYLATSPEVEGVTGKYFAKSKETTPSAAARDEAVAQRLWEVSEAMTGLKTTV